MKLAEAISISKKKKKKKRVDCLQHKFSFCSVQHMKKKIVRGGFKTQPPVDQRFRPVPGGCHCLDQ